MIPSPHSAPHWGVEKGGGKFNERRVNHGSFNPLGDIPNCGKGKSEEREEIHFDGLLQQSLNGLSTAGSCYLS
jgi:hypothetical protein